MGKRFKLSSRDGGEILLPLYEEKVPWNTKRSLGAEISLLSASDPGTKRIPDGLMTDFYGGYLEFNTHVKNFLR